MRLSIDGAHGCGWFPRYIYPSNMNLSVDGLHLKPYESDPKLIGDTIVWKIYFLGKLDTISSWSNAETSSNGRKEKDFFQESLKQWRSFLVDSRNETTS